MSTLTSIARELCYNYGISGLVLNDDGTDPQTMAKVFSAIDQAVDELGTGQEDRRLYPDHSSGAGERQQCPERLQ